MNAAYKGVPQSTDETSTEAADRFSLRLRIPSGLLSADQLGVLCDLSRGFGLGFIHLTARQGVEIPGIQFADLGAVQSALAAAGLSAGGPGVRVRNVVACTGSGKCAHAFLDSAALSRALDLLFGGEDFPAQVKIAVAGCPNSCTAPQVAEIGFVGTVEPLLDRNACDGCGKCAGACSEKALTMRRGLPRRDPPRCDYCGACVVVCPLRALRPGRLGYTVFVGGRAGKRPQIGAVLARFLPEDEAPDVAARVLGFLRDEGQPRERLHALLRRAGLESLRAYVHSRPLHRTAIREMSS